MAKRVLTQSEVWTRVNSEGERIYIGVQFDDGRMVAATNACTSPMAAQYGMFLRGEQPAWVWANREHFQKPSAR